MANLGKSAASLVITLIILTAAVRSVVGDGVRCHNVSRQKGSKPTEIQTVLEKNEALLLLLVGFGGLSVILAVVYVLIRRHVFDDFNNLDSSFDAGGNVSASLTAVTIAAQLLWPADLMQSATIAVKYGIAGVFWYCSSVLINLSLFPLLSFKFKTRAPGAKTYLQIILARFGRPAHSIFCVFALLVNIIVLTSILVGGIAVLSMTVKDATPEFSVLILAILCGSYSFIGGLGSTFYVSYFNALTTCLVLTILVISVFYTSDAPFGTLEEIYLKVNCTEPVPGNKDGSHFTFLSEGAMLFAVQGLFLVSSITYCDQASWQSRIAAKPLQGAVGFLLAGFIWFAIPATVGLVTGITYLAQSSVDETVMLTDEQINSGIVSAYMSQLALGKQGGIMMLTMLTMLTMSTGSGEIMGVCSIIVYDIYQTYIRPFRFKLPPTHCVFCGLPKHNNGRHSTAHTPTAPTLPHTTPNLTPQPSVSSPHPPVCKCPPALTCSECKADIQRSSNSSKNPGKFSQHQCRYHGNFRTYQDSLIEFKNWCVLWVTICLVPFGLAVNASGVNLNWTLLVGTILTVPSFPGVILCIIWSRTTSKGMIVGCLSGLVCGVTSDLLVAYVYYKGEGGFLVCTAELYAVVAGSGISMLVSLTLTVLVSLSTHQIAGPEDEDREWSKMRDIDNPLHPWSQQFVEEYPEVLDGQTRPSYTQLEHVSRHGRLAAIIGVVSFVFIFIVLIPGSMASLQVLTSSEFRSWTTVISVWCFIMTVITAVVTPFEEVKAIVLQLRVRKKRRQQACADACSHQARARRSVEDSLDDRSLSSEDLDEKMDMLDHTGPQGSHRLTNGSRRVLDSNQDCLDRRISPPTKTKSETVV
ncbi:uncharacterized protein LOC131947185 [Physella acuta]|uniref:uncharacterized protein LOC131947185 n=1 Tax=Physella acuta TaxID=109671 RepID=UPI0027DC05BA|nr:uncharacterized protein LOC131947185 [Physella acuta]XP_059164310.1 uncharacterized protein LOC131947185 [Physella acuta]XP_059164311.1 uncharacterized protein LOC131947185 [Physella acuta]XP_059164312.1 uncharacterized protein LOC131947185 [Physella acuta]